MAQNKARREQSGKYTWEMEHDSVHPKDRALQLEVNNEKTAFILVVKASHVR